MSKRKQKILTKEEIFRRNPGIDTALIGKSESLAEELRKHGLELRSNYNISPPLGRTSIRLYNETHQANKPVDVSHP